MPGKLIPTWFVIATIAIVSLENWSNSQPIIKTMSNTMTGTLKEQRQVYWAGLEMPNGEPAQIRLYIARILKEQDLVYWQGNPVGFDQWLRKEVCDYVNSCCGVVRSKEGRGA